MATTGTYNSRQNQNVQVGSVEVKEGPVFLAPGQTIDMADAEVALTIPTLTSNVLYVDANSGATEDLLLPPEAQSDGLFLFIANTGGEAIVVKDDGDATTVGTIATAEVGYFFCDGTTWRGGVSTNT